MDVKLILRIMFWCMAKTTSGLIVDISLEQSDDQKQGYRPTTSVVQMQPVSTVTRCANECIDHSKYYGIFYSRTTKQCLCSTTLHRPISSMIQTPGYRYYLPELCEIGGYKQLEQGLCVKQYPLHLSNSMYYDSTEHCEADSGRLVRLDTMEKYIALGDYLTAVTDTSELRIFYIDGVRNQNNEWVFSDGSHIPSSTFVWAAGEPHTDKCLVLWTAEYKHGDTLCTYPPGSATGFICERLV